MKIGILLHVYHLETEDWERLVWGDPGADELGIGTKFVECLLDIPADQEVVSIVYGGPSVKNGMGEGAHTKQYLLEQLDSLDTFPRLRRRLERLTPAEYSCFMARLHGLQISPSVKNTLAEVHAAGKYFGEQQTDIVIQVAAATHAARCLRDQTVAREQGIINRQQPWFVAASDIGIANIAPSDVVIAEPLHRTDNPLYGFRPAWAELAKHYAFLSLENKKKFLVEMDVLMTKLLADQPDDTPMVN